MRSQTVVSEGEIGLVVLATLGQRLHVIDVERASLSSEIDCSQIKQTPRIVRPLVTTPGVGRRLLLERWAAVGRATIERAMRTSTPAGGWSRNRGAGRMNAVTAEAMIERAGRALIDAAPAPAKVILFGSHARGDASEESDFDFLVIEETVPNRLAEAVRLRDALGDFNAPVDVIVMDAALAGRRAKVRGTMVHRALREGRVLAES
jgi:predicted nucleotidyltransferase